MSRKHSRDNVLVQTTCGIWTTFCEYKRHRIQCILCKDVEFSHDLRYDVLLSCRKDFMRTLTHQQYKLHQQNCCVCAQIGFDDIKSEIENSIDKLNRIHFEQIWRNTRIKELIRVFKDAEETLLSTRDIERCAYRVRYEINCCDDYLYSENCVHDSATVEQIIQSINRYQDDLMNASKNMQQANCALHLEMQGKKDLLDEKKIVQQQIMEFAGNNLVFLDDNRMSFNSCAGICRIDNPCKTDCCVKSFEIYRPQPGKYIEVRWTIYTNEFYRISGILETEWICFFRCFLLAQEKQYFYKLGNELVFVPLVVKDCVLGFLHFSTFQLLDALHVYLEPFLENQTLARRHITNFIVTQLEQL